MRTSEEIYHQVRWDPRFDPSRFLLGVESRGQAPKRIPLPMFTPGGDIPWHRVLFIEADGELVWDRATGLDRVGATGAGRARRPRLLAAPFFSARTPYAWDAARSIWRTADEPVASGATLGRIRVLTWNTLWDRYDGDRIDTARRHPLLMAALREADADVIALQEVEKPLLGMLLREPWVRAGYTVGSDPKGADVDAAGLLLLSRLPVLEAGWHALAPYKALGAVVVDTLAGPLAVAVTHLSSDHSENGADRRDRELTRIAEGLAAVDCDVVLVGDFNDGGSAPVTRLGVRDAWSQVHGADDQTPTFDPGVNALAAVSSLTGRAARLDRILTRGSWQAVSAQLLGTVPTDDGLHVSDHYGVEAVLEVGNPSRGTPAESMLDVPATVRTALAWLPPEDLWPAVQEVRRRHDPQIDRWPPHVNILFGFVPESRFEDAVPLFAAAVAELAPFTAVLDGVRTFQHQQELTIWLDPAAGGGEPWEALHAAVQGRFPRCTGRAEGYTPHLTLGRAASAPPVRIGAMTARVGELVLLSRRGGEPMRVRAVVGLGSGEVRWVDEPASAQQISVLADASCRAADPVRLPVELTAHTAEAVALVQRVERMLPGSALHVVGSRRMACHLPGADLDLVAAVAGHVDIDAVVRAVRTAVPEATRLRPVLGARVPGLRFTAGGLDVDLSLVATGDLPPARAIARRHELGEEAAMTLSAVTDADALLAASTSFVDLARPVKAWARARGLDAAPFGGLPGLAWTQLAVLVAREAPNAAPRELLGRFFGTWAAWDWRDVVALDGAGPGPAGSSSAAMVVVTPSAPHRNCAEQVGPGMRDLIAAELYRAWEIVEDGDDPLPRLLAAPPLHRRHAAWAIVSVETSGAAEFQTVLGRVRGRMRSLITTLEEAGVVDVHAWPRPFETGPTRARFAVGLGAHPPDAADLGEITERWARGLPGVTVRWADNGVVPTLE